MSEETNGWLERKLEMKRRLMRHVLEHWNEDVSHTASDGFGELLTDAHDEMAEELLLPIFNWSDFWSQRMAAEILGLPTDDEYECSELLELFEARERQENEPQQTKPPKWSDEGF